MSRTAQKLSLISVLFVLSFVLTGCTSSKTPAVQKPQSSNSPQITIVDTVWNKYENNSFHYALNVPKEFYIENGMCTQDAKTQQFVYKVAPTTTKVFEVGNYTYITPGLIYAIKDNNCEPVQITAEQTQDSKINKWALYAFKAVNPQEIDQAINAVFGTDYALEVLKPTKDSNMYDIVIKNKNDEKVTMPYFAKYNDEKGVGVLLPLGNSFIFKKDADSSNSFYEEEMLKSFEFTD